MDGAVLTLPTDAEAKHAYEVMSGLYDHIVRNVLLPKLRENPEENAEAIAKLEKSLNRDG